MEIMGLTVSGKEAALSIWVLRQFAGIGDLPKTRHPGAAYLGTDSIEASDLEQHLVLPCSSQRLGCQPPAVPARLD